MECSICLYKCGGAPADEPAREQGRTVPCDHSFCVECIVLHTTSKLKRGTTKQVCPYCMSPIRSFAVAPGGNVIDPLELARKRVPKPPTKTDVLDPGSFVNVCGSLYPCVIALIFSYMDLRLENATARTVGAFTEIILSMILNALVQIITRHSPYFVLKYRLKVLVGYLRISLIAYVVTHITKNPMYNLWIGHLLIMQALAVCQVAIDVTPRPDVVELVREVFN